MNSACVCVCCFYERWALIWSRSLGIQPAGDLVINPLVGCHYFPPQLPSQQKSITTPWPVPNYTAWWQRHTGDAQDSNPPSARGALDPAGGFTGSPSVPLTDSRCTHLPTTMGRWFCVMFIVIINYDYYSSVQLKNVESTWQWEKDLITVSCRKKQQLIKRRSAVNVERLGSSVVVNFEDERFGDVWRRSVPHTSSGDSECLILGTDITLLSQVSSDAYISDVQCHADLTYRSIIFNFWHSGTLALRAERQSARMSEIENDRLRLHGIV